MRLIALLVALCTAVVLGVLIQHDSGYILVAYKPWVVELPLWLGGLLFVVLVMAITACFMTLHKMSVLGERWGRWARVRQVRLSQERTQKGLLAFNEGKYADAEKWLVRGAEHSEVPLLNYLTAARAAQEQGDTSRRDAYLKQAHNAADGTDLAVGLTQAQLQFREGQLEQALATLEQLRSLSPKHPLVLKMLRTLYEALEDWNALSDLLGDLSKLRIIPKEEHQRLEQHIARERFEKTISEAPLTETELQARWKGLPKTLHSDARLVALQVAQWERLGKADEAEPLLQHALKHQVDDALFALYGQLNVSHPEKALAFLESSLPDVQESPILFLALGRLCLRAKLWGKAQSYLESSLSLKRLPEASAELAQLLERQGKVREANEQYRQGLLSHCEVVSLPTTEKETTR